MEQLLVWASSMLASAFVGSYLGGYLKTKGQNLATHEDLVKLVAQMEASTRATKAIEAKFSGELWDRQRHWELKRDAVLEAMQALGRANEVLQMLGAVAYRELGDCGTPTELWDVAMHPYVKSWQQTRDAFDDKMFSAAFLCSDEFGDTLHTLAVRMNEAASVAMSKKPFNKSVVFFPIELEIKAVLTQARRELGIDRPRNHEKTVDTRL